jgi:lysophospholipase L1-like esterase
MLEKSLTLALAALLSLACSDSEPNDLTAGSGPVGNAGAGTLAMGGNPGSGGASANASGGTSSGGVQDRGAGGTANGSGLGGVGAGGAGATATLAWLPSWATTIQSTEVANLPPPLANNTLRQFVWPTVSGQEIRIQLSNERGSAPVDIQKVHIAKAKTEADPANSAGQIDVATDAAFTFNGLPNVTIPAGQTVWSDPLAFSLQEITLTAISMQFGAGIPTEITGHPGARTTSYVADGDAISAEALAGAQTRDRWYFIDAIEVMAPADAYAIAVLGDSITDGYGVLNQFARWTDFLTLAIQNDAQIADTRSVLNFGMGANNLTVSGAFQDSGLVRFGRDVVPRDKIKWLIVLEGINDIVYSNVQAQPIIDAYSQIITTAHAEGILVYGATITPTNQGDATIRGQVNEWIRTSGQFDQVIDFASLIVDPNDPNAILPTYNNDGLHPNAAGYAAMGNAVPLSLFYAPMAPMANQ